MRLSFVVLLSLAVALTTAVSLVSPSHCRRAAPGDFIEADEVVVVLETDKVRVRRAADALALARLLTTHHSLSSLSLIDSAMSR